MARSPTELRHAFTHRLQPYDFANRRHIGPSPAEMAEMLKVLGANSLDALIDADRARLDPPERAARPGARRMTEREALDKHARDRQQEPGAGLADRPGLLRHHHAAGRSSATSWKTRPGTPPTRPTSPRSARAGWRRC